MKTLTVTEGRGRLGHWLAQAVRGEDIGIVLGNRIVALRPVEVYTDDYALREYGLTEAETRRAARRIHAEIKAARRRGELTKFTGSRDDFH